MFNVDWKWIKSDMLMHCWPLFDPWIITHQHISYINVFTNLLSKRGSMSVWPKGHLGDLWRSFVSDISWNQVKSEISVYLRIVFIDIMKYHLITNPINLGFFSTQPIDFTFKTFEIIPKKHSSELQRSPYI